MAQRRWLLGLAILGALIWAANAFGLLDLSFTRSVEDHKVYYRLVAKYQHANQIIDFDIVVGCGVRVTRYGDGGSSYDAFRDPVAYVKAIKGGAAVMQIVPSACLGETSENGKVPDDFLPGAVWFEHADDLSFGIAYVTEDAFESPRSQLKFLGAAIQPATRSDYIAFEPMAATNLIDPRPLFTIMPPPDIDKLRRHLGDSKALAKVRPSMDCRSMQRLHVSHPMQRAIIREYWPTSRPHYWMPSEQTLKEIEKKIHLWNKMIVDGRPAGDYFHLNWHAANGFPTRAQGGRLYTKHKEWDPLPPTVFPLRTDEGIPWITKNHATATTLYRDIDIGKGMYQGFAYCYGSINFEVPAYLNDSFQTRVDGEPIFGETTDERMPRDRPWPFFERDEYFYFEDRFGLN